MNLHINTYGDTRCAKHLVHVLNGYGIEKYNRKVGRYLASCNRLINALEFVPGRSERVKLARILRDEINRFHLKETPAEVISLTKNVAITALAMRILDVQDVGDSPMDATEEFNFD